MEAGAGVFSERGYEKASMREIAREAGVTTPVVYDHFASKRDLYVALLDEQEARLRAHQGRVRGLEPGPELARALIEDFFSWVQANPRAWRMLFYDVPADSRVFAAQRSAQRRSAAQIASFVALAPELRIGAPLGRSQVEELLGESIYAVVNRLAAWWWDRREVPRDHLVSLAHELLWGGLAAIAGPEAPDPLGDGFEESGGSG